MSDSSSITGNPPPQEKCDRGRSGLAPLIVVEGIDGSGKGTQSRQLVATLRERDFQCELFSFPRYDDTFFGARIGDFLNGRFGSLEDLDPFLVSLLYAGDRFESKNAIEQARQANEVLICDRYVSSNIGHQAAKRSGAERDKLQSWIEHVEYEIFGLPRPTRVILLDIPVEQSQQLIARKAPRGYTDQKADLQEADVDYLDRVRHAYLNLAQDDPLWSVIPVTCNQQVRPVSEIASEILEVVLPVLNPDCVSES